MSAMMDMYFSNSESLSLPEMLDIDIKSEIDMIFGASDASGINFSDLPPLELDDVHDIRWFSHNSNLSNSSFTLDFGNEDANIMVNPNSVMPVISLTQTVRSPTPQLKESHLSFSPASIKLAEIKADTVSVKKDLLKKIESPIVVERVVEKKIMPSVVKTINKITPILSKSITKTITKPAPTLLTFRNTINRQVAAPVTVAQLTNLGTVRTITANHGRKQQFNNNRIYDEDVKAFPKPAYSYSCLIAMALKNSKTGSLPVSEIYNFMCKHFPYFKTAPNGWKNSVRHNLSLNKCFEKIEKPALNGAQRKGCLWAMNPLKISKMDEEVQKWSRKDPTAIRKAMINPENLEALERGELKFSCSFDEDGFGDSCGSAESEEGSDSEQEVEITNKVPMTAQFIDIRSLKPAQVVEEEEDDEEEEEEEDEGEEYDVQIAESLYEDEVDVEDEQEILRMEVALAQKELFEYGRSANNKRRKTYIIQN